MLKEGKKTAHPYRVCCLIRMIIIIFCLQSNHCKTGRSSLGWKGTLQGLPHSAQTASNISRVPLLDSPLGVFASGCGKLCSAEARW